VLSADILYHLAVKNIKFFTCLNDLYAIASRNIHQDKWRRYAPLFAL
jgi:hypothetical protein